VLGIASTEKPLIVCQRCVMVIKFREAELGKEGWSRQFTSDEPRLSEAV
jgi:hypothetical protein